MTKFQNKSFRYASELGSEDSAHGSSNYKNEFENDALFDGYLSVCGLHHYRDHYFSIRKKFINFTEVEPELFEVSSPFALFRDYIKEQHISLADEHSSVLIHLCSFLYWLKQSKTLMDYSVASLNLLTSLGYNPITLFMRWEIPTDLFDFANLADDDISSLEPEGFEQITENWRLLKSNPIFSKLSKSFSVLATLVTCLIEKRDFNISWMETINTSLSKIHTSAFDAVDAIIESVCWMGSSGVAIIRTGSITPLLFSNPLVREFDDLFIKVYADRSRAINGDLDSLDKYEKELRRCVDVIDTLNNQKLDWVIRRYLHEKYALLISVQDSIFVKRKNCEMRFCPIGFSLFGGSGVGKTTVAKMIMRTSLSCMGFDYGEDKQITLDMNDKYHSTLTNDIQGIYFDDLANTTAEFAANGQIPSNVIIKFFNNVPGQAIKADVSDKGKTMINLKCGIVTTNREDLDAPKYSNCPLSILRRLFHITVAIKPEFQSSVNGVKTGMLDQQHPRLLAQANIGDVDVWDFTIKVAVPAQKDTCTFSVYIHKFSNNLPAHLAGGQIKCINLGLLDLLLIVKDLSLCHKNAQELLLKSSRNSPGALCSGCCLPKTLCMCPSGSISSDESSVSESSLTSQSINPEALFHSWFDPIVWLAPAFGYKPLDSIRPDFMYSYLLKYSDIGFIGVSPYIPEVVYNSDIYRYVFSYPAQRLVDFEWDINRYFEKISYQYRYHYLIALVFSFLFSLCFQIDILSFVVIVGIVDILWITILREIKHQRRQILENSIIQSRVSLSTLTRRVRDDIVPKSVLAISGVAAVLIAFRYMYSMYINSRTDTQGSLDQDEIDKQPSWFGNLFKGNTQKVIAGVESNRLPSQTANALQRNLFFTKFCRDDGSEASCCTFCPRTGVVIFPKHMFYPNGNMDSVNCKILTLSMRRHKSYGGLFLIVINWEKCFFFGDLAICHFSNGPSLRDVTHIFSEKITGKGYCELIKRTDEFEILTDKVFATHGKTGHKHMAFIGSSYNTHLTGKGTCMSVLVNDENPSHIVGFHIGGCDSLGVSIHLPASTLLEAISTSATYLCGTEGSELIEYPKEVMGKPFIIGPAHQFAHHRELDANTCFEVLGSSRLRKQSKSSVERGYLYDAMVDTIGVKDIWKAPDMMPNWKHYNLFLEKVTKPSLPFNPVDVCRAASDYIAPLLNKCDEYKGLRRPLTLKESIMGIEGKRFYDALIMNTSMGYPIFGKKKNHFRDIYDERGLLIDRIPSDEIFTEMERLIQCYKSGHRGCPVFTACLKDEVKEVDSEKVRVFTACPVAFSILVRMYFLPIAVFFKYFPLDSEMAVGVNAFGLQWQDLMEFTEAYADEDGGNFGMDYSSYDTRMNSQITRAVYGIMIDIAARLGYSDDELSFMRNMVDDLTFPIVDINGTVYQLYHMNPSGVNLTVEVNCIGNSLYMRLAFFHYYPKIEDFRKFVHLMTYGDDNKCSVKPSCRSQFSFLTVQSYLSNHDIKITAPDKKSQGEHFFDDDKLDFLKRQSHFIPEINRDIGKLEELSILKSLMYNVKSSVSKKQVALSCIDSAMHEWFAFGKNHYEMRRNQMIQVCESLDICDYPTLQLTFDDRVRTWLEAYRSS